MFERIDDDEYVGSDSENVSCYVIHVAGMFEISNGRCFGDPKNKQAVDNSKGEPEKCLE